MGLFKITCYYTPRETDFSGRRAFMQVVRREGYGIARDGRLCSYNGRCQPNPDQILGKTALGTPLVEGRTVAVDRTRIGLGTALQLRFHRRAGERCFTPICLEWEQKKLVAEDVGSNIRGKEIDVFIGLGNRRSNRCRGLPRYAEVFIQGTERW